jgi:3-oxoacyl-[acyl-carrier-protein] synthase II
MAAQATYKEGRGMSRRVVVTGMGAVSPLGLDVPALWQGILECRSGAGPITLCDPEGLETQFACEVKGFDPQNYLDRKEARRNSRFIQLAMVAAQEALRTSELQISAENSADVGVLIGSGMGGLEWLVEQIDVLRVKGPRRVSPFLVPAMITNMAAGQVSIMSGARGPNLCTTSACSSGAHAIGEAGEIIRRGWANAMIVGGSEASITRIGVAAFNSATTLSTRNEDPLRASRPFDATRDGFVLAEGAAVLILEELEHARARGARILAELAGYGATGDAYHITSPAEGGEGAVRSMGLALRQAGLKPADIGYINAHGTSTNANDRLETAAVKTLFGEQAGRVPISSSKSQFGHLLGAAGALEAVVSILAMQHNTLPATINYEHPDPECDLDYVPNATRAAQVDAVMSNSMGFGGHNVSLVFRRYQ